MKDNLAKTNAKLSGRITKDGFSKSIHDPCGVYSFRLKAKSVLCVQCGKWILDKCTGVKIVTAKFTEN